MKIDTTLGTAQAGIAFGGIAAVARRQPVGGVRGLLGLDHTV
ncbi:MAG: hypothetical protein ACE367_26270 [Acidimicrobiales bacterium]